ncbi:MAG: sigma-70 family RNA polymerase sigma factor [Prevotella sp.]|nr:sigma-70 family RNA polymerase sigma factor [Prevotella sp.]
MTIYFVNRNSNLKGPFDIIDANRQHIIKVGDICLRDTTKGVEFLVVYTPNNSWSACKCVGVGKSDQFKNDGNTLVFTFDGIHKRKGDALFMSLLVQCFREKVIVEFFLNAVEILQYRSDCWDGSLFPQFFADSQVYVTPRSKNPIHTSNESGKYPTDFSKYLDNRLLESLLDSLKRGDSIKKAYVVLRALHPQLFRKALMRFLVENPNGTIFDKTPDNDVSETETSEADNNADAGKKEPEKVIDISSEMADEYTHFVLNDYDNFEFNKLLRRYRKGDKKALDKIVKSNIKLVTALANSYKDHGIEYEDLVQEGTIGLIKAVDRFNPHRKVRFPEYAKWWIHVAFVHALDTIGTSIRIPSNQLNLYKKLRKRIERYEQEHGYEPSPSDIEIEGYDDPQNIELLSKLPDSLDKLTVNTVDLDEIPTPDSATDDFITKDAQAQFVDAVLNNLPSREARILRLKYGIGERIESLSEIGRKFGLTRERARQISEKAVSKIRDFIDLSKKESADDNTQEEKEKTNRQDLRVIENQKITIKPVDIPEPTETSKPKKPTKPKVKKKLEYLSASSTKSKKTTGDKQVAELLKTKTVISGGAEVGDEIKYYARNCVVLEKKTINNSHRLIVKYEDGTIDNLIDEKGKYIIVKKVIEHIRKEKYLSYKEVSPSRMSLTRRNTYNYYIKGLTIEQIAEKRELSISTICDHFAFFISSGYVNLYDVLSTYKIEAISKAIAKVGVRKLSEIRDRCPDDITYDDIKLVIAHIQSK